MTPLQRQLLFHGGSGTTFLYRALVVGLLGAIALLLATTAVGPARPAARAPGVAIVDVSQRAAGDRVVEFLGLAPGERVIAIDDVAAATDQVVDVWRATAPGRYLDLTVAGNGAVRRVLVLVHR